MDRQDRIVIASGAFALVFLIAGYIKESDMRIHLTFAGQDNKTQLKKPPRLTRSSVIGWLRHDLQPLHD